jgi:hypothetical protein
LIVFIYCARGGLALSGLAESGLFLAADF